MSAVARDRADGLLDVLRNAGYDVRLVDPIEATIDAEVADTIDALAADVTRASEGRINTLAHLAQRADVPLIVYTSAPDVRTGVEGLDRGADDLLTSSMSPHEIVARVRAVLRRRPKAARRKASDVLACGPVALDMGRRRARVRGVVVFLTALELKLLSYFLMHPDEPLTRDQLLDAVWGHSVGGTATVTVHVRRLREKIESDPADPMLIRTVWGVGYRFSPSDA